MEEFVNFKDLLKNIDPKLIQQFYPTAADKEQFETAKAAALQILGLPETGDRSPELMLQLESCFKKLQDIYARLSDRTELGAKARLNEAVVLSEAGLLERAVFLAGVAREKNLPEPYKTQLQVLPANACLNRYRQVCRVRAWTLEQTRATSPTRQEIAGQLLSMESNLFSLFWYFATQAHLDNPSHPFAAYLRMLSFLLAAERREPSALSEVEGLVKAATLAINRLEKPTSESHYMILQYHEMNNDEFSSYPGFRERYPEIAARLRALSEMARESRPGFKPKESYPYVPYVVRGARAVSVVSFLCLLAPTFGIEAKDIASAVQDAWTTLTQHLTTSADTWVSAKAIAANAGAFAEWLHAAVPDALNQIDLATHKGGLAVHTGGLA